MAALLASDNDSDFGYDFSAEEEALLIELAGATSTHPRPSAGAGAETSPTSASLPSAASVIDSVPGKTESVAGDDLLAMRCGREKLTLGASCRLPWSNHGHARLLQTLLCLRASSTQIVCAPLLKPSS
jgi:hypothetical protein